MRCAIEVVLGVLLLSVIVACGSGSSGGGGYAGPVPGAPPGGGGDLELFAEVTTAAGQRLGNVPVYINGHGPYLSNERGIVEVTGVAAPYEAVVIDGASGTAYVYQGVTRTDPVFEITKELSRHTFAFEGNVHGGTATPGPNTRTVVLIEVTSDGVRKSVDANPISGFFASGGNITWEGPPDTDVILVALQYEVDADGLPTTFSGYGRTRIQVHRGDVLGGVQFTMDAVPTSSLSGWDLPFVGYQRFLRRAIVRLDDGIVLRLPSGPDDDFPFSFQVPVIPGASLGVLSDTMSPTGSYESTISDELPAPSSSLSLTLGIASELALPYDGAVGVDHETQFLVGPDTGDRVHEVLMRPGVAGPTVVLRTAETAFTIPDLTPFGMGLPSGAEYHWKVDAWSPVATVDETLVPGFTRRGGGTSTDRHWSTTTYWWYFTTD